MELFGKATKWKKLRKGCQARARAYGAIFGTIANPHVTPNDETRDEKFVS